MSPHLQGGGHIDFGVGHTNFSSGNSLRGITGPVSWEK